MNYFLVEEDGLDQVPGWVYASGTRFRSEKRPRGEIPEPDSNISLTAEMINVFRGMV